MIRKGLKPMILLHKRQETVLATSLRATILYLQSAPV